MPNSSQSVHSPFKWTKPTDEERDEKRDALLLSAVRLFNKKGFHATSLDEVASSLGVTKPVIYHYLGNKEQVLFECVRLGLESLRSEVGLADGQTGLERLKAFLRRYARVIMSDFGQCVIRTGDEVLSPESAAKFRALKREIDEALRDMVREAVNDGSAETEDIRITAFAFAGALNWTARWYQTDGSETPEAIADGLVEALCAGIEPRTIR